MFSLGASRFQVFAKVVVLWAMPWVVGTLLVNIGLALAGAIVDEFVALRYGVGRMILYAGQMMWTSTSSGSGSSRCRFWHWSCVWS